MTKEDYMTLPKDKLVNILYQKDLEDDYGRGIYHGWTPSTNC